MPQKARGIADREGAVGEAGGDNFNLPKDECPHVLDLPPIGQIDAIRSAMPGLVLHRLGLARYGNGTSYRGWQIIAAMSLQPTYATPVPGAVRWRARALATARCGAHAAEESWLVTLRFPNMHLIDSVGRFYVALTRSG